MNRDTLSMYHLFDNFDKLVEADKVIPGYLNAVIKNLMPMISRGLMGIIEETIGELAEDFLKNNKPDFFKGETLDGILGLAVGSNVSLTLLFEKSEITCIIGFPDFKIKEKFDLVSCDYSFTRENENPFESFLKIGVRKMFSDRKVQETPFYDMISERDLKENNPFYFDGTKLN